LVIYSSIWYAINFKTWFLPNKCKSSMGKEKTRKCYFCDSRSLSILLSWCWIRWQNMEFLLSLGNKFSFLNQLYDIWKRLKTNYSWIRFWKDTCLWMLGELKRNSGWSCRVTRTKASYETCDGSFIRFRTLISNFNRGRWNALNNGYKY